MRRARPFFRAARRALALAALCGACVQGAATADAPPPDQAAVSSKIPLSPELEAKFKTFVDKAKVEKGKVWTARMDKEIADITTSTGLGDDGQKALEPAAKQAVQSAVDDWSTQLSDLMRKGILMQPVQASLMLDQITANITAIVQSDWPGETSGKPPYQQDSWLKALQQTLTPAQAAAWDKTLADRKDAVVKGVGDFLKIGAEKTHQMQTQQIMAECKAIELSLGLPQDRADKLEKLGQSVVDQTTELWRKRVEDMLMTMDDNQRMQYSRNAANITIGPVEAEAPDQQASWKDGLAGILTADEKARLQAANDARQAKRTHVMGQIMITLLDEKLALTTKQRQQLQPIADRLVKDVPELSPNGGPNSSYSYPPQVFFATARNATEAELKPILDDTQSKRWQHLSDPDNMAATLPSVDDDKSTPDDDAGPDYVEKVISNLLYEKMTSERKRMLKVNMVRVEDIVRATGLSAESEARLQVAARGATEEDLANWKWFTEQQLRAQLQDVTPQNVKQRVANFQNMFFQSGVPTNVSRPGVWEKTVQSELNPAQQALWQKETDERQAFREQAIASMVLIKFDGNNQLTSDQWDKLQPIIAGIVRDYGPQISQMFPAMNNNALWYLGSQLAMIPFAGVPDTELKTILTKDQVDGWHAAPDYAMATSWWNNIQQMHNQAGRTMLMGNQGSVRVIRTIKVINK